MFTAYIDDSGTAPSQKVAIATGLVIPSKRALRFHSEWKTFAQKVGISDFHSAECAAGNPKSEFAGWEETKITSTFARVRQITMKYGAKCFSLAVNKSDYNALIPAKLRPTFGEYHYTWAIHSLLAMLDNWTCRSGVEQHVEYIFDWMDPNSQRLQKHEIDQAFDHSEKGRPGRFAGHYSFRRRIDYPGLQCVDLLGWTCYRYALNVFVKTPLTNLQRDCWLDFSNYRVDEPWLVAIGQTAKQIQEAVESQMRGHGLILGRIRPFIDGRLSDRTPPRW